MEEQQTKAAIGSKELPSAFSLFNISSELVKKNLGLFAIVFIFPVLSALGNLLDQDKSSSAGSPNFGSGLPGGGLSGEALAGLIGAGIIFLIVIAAVQILLYAFRINLELKAADNLKPSFSDVWMLTKKYWLRLFLLALITGIVVVAGFIFFIIPGIIFLRRYMLAPYHLVDKDLGVMEALNASAEQSKKNTMAIYGVLGVMLLLALIGIVPLVGEIVSVVLLALYSVAPALRYRQIQ